MMMVRLPLIMINSIIKRNLKIKNVLMVFLFPSLNFSNPYIENGCKVLKNTYSKQNVTNWKGFRGLCIQKLKGVNYLETATLITIQGKCPEGYLHCGVRGSTRTEFCVPKNKTKKCPITGILIAEKNPNPSIYPESILLSQYKGKVLLHQSKYHKIKSSLT